MIEILTSGSFFQTLLSVSILGFFVCVIVTVFNYFTNLLNVKWYFLCQKGVIFFFIPIALAVLNKIVKLQVSLTLLTVLCWIALLLLFMKKFLRKIFEEKRMIKEGRAWRCPKCKTLNSEILAQCQKCNTERAA